MKYYFIINPQSGKLNKKQIEDNIREVCLKREIPYRIMYTEYGGDAKRIAGKISDTEECVVFSVGGDGNLNEVLNGIVGSKNKILGNIPTGSGNDFDRTLKLQDTGIHSIDLGKINGRYFINVACVGLDADVANHVLELRNKKWIPVKQRYNASLIYTYFKYQFKNLKIRMGKTTVENECTILAICNGQYYGGGYRIAPHALINDGMFDIYLVEKMSKPKILSVLVKLLRAKHENSPSVKRYEDSKVIIDSDEDYTFNVDGEMITSNHFELEIEKNALRVFNDRKFIEAILKD
ncbi:MAG: diacylglycerol/lipid kinase family protein [Eubacterium sp.]